jgi:hypothetical protein
MKERAINKQNEPQKERKSRWRMYNKKPAKENGASHPLWRIGQLKVSRVHRPRIIDFLNITDFIL